MVLDRISSFIERNSLTVYLFYLLSVATVGPLLFGYHLGELNAPAEVLQCQVKPSASSTAISLPQCLDTTPLTFGLIQSIFTLGGLVGALAAGPISTTRGRLWTMRVNTVFCILGPVLEALATNVPVMVIGRVLAGVGAGASLVVVPIYISEIAPANVRGFFGAFTQIATNAGIFLAQLLGLFLSKGSLWRIILAVAGAVGGAQFLGLLFAVDSPKWLGEHDRPRDAKNALRRIRGKNADIDNESKAWTDAEGEGAGTEHESLLSHPDPAADDVPSTSSPAKNNSANLTIPQILRHPLYPRALLAVTIVMVTQQLTGINSIIMYGVSLLSSLLPQSSAQLNVFVSVLNIICTTAFAPLVDILGRKRCLLLSITGMGVSSVLLGIGIRAGIKILSAITVLTFVGSFALGLGPVPFMLSSELVGPEAVGSTQSWALAASWISTFLVAQFFPLMNETLGKGVAYFVFAGVAAVAFVLVGWFVPETMGKSGFREVWGWDGAEHTD